mmetsp:Transcript_40133/g.83582  ORF Transcript_40133/g.83582 Transcript_40133/m.83582 type:complete len:198 (-) Transcript_40133:3233-3826(-)
MVTVWKRIAVGLWALMIQLPLAIHGFHPSCCATEGISMATKRTKATTASLQASSNEESSLSSRRNLLQMASTLAFTTAFAPTPAAFARYVLDEETGDYVELQDVPWQDEWKARLDKASGMTQEEIFQAARGAGNIDLKEGPESPASQKRRALSACRNATVRSNLDLVDEKACTVRVLSGGSEGVDFVLQGLSNSQSS